MREQLVGRDVRAAVIAARQHGLITFDQLLAIGFTPSTISRRVKVGHLHRIHRAVYAVGHPGVTDRGRWKAATLACGEGCALSHRSAGELWGIVKPDAGLVHVTVPVTGGRATRKGIRIHRSPSLTAQLVTARHGISVTRPRRTLEDLRNVLGDAALRDALRRADFLNLPLDGFRLGEDPGDSELERMFLVICRRFRIRTPETQVGIGPFRVDFLWRPERLIVETDGYGSHGGSIAFEDDRARDNRLAELGYEVRRFTHRQLTAEPAGVARLIRSRLAARRVIAEGR